MGTIFSKEHLKLMKELEVPIVIAAQELDNYSCVYQDDYHAAYEAAKLLLKREHISVILVLRRRRKLLQDLKQGV